MRGKNFGSVKRVKTSDAMEELGKRRRKWSRAPIKWDMKAVHLEKKKQGKNKQ